jgi:ADP-ribose pyrophosphatase
MPKKDKKKTKKTKKTAKKSAVAKVKSVKKLKVDGGKAAEVLSSNVSYSGPLFRVLSEEIQEPNGKRVHREIIRHNGSVVILAIDKTKSKKDPLVLIERQFRHAAQQFLYEVPAGKLETAEDHLDAAKRELLEETGFQAKKWTKLVRYFASPGFLGEWMQVFLAEDVTAGEAHPEEDESFELQFVPLSELLRLIGEGKILDGKTIVAATFYARYAGRGKK